MTDLVPYEPRPQTSLELAPQAWKLAEKIAGTEFVPGPLRGKPEAVLACILAGHEAGVGPMQALAKIHVIDGRPAMAAELMRALVLQHGHELAYEETTTTRVTAAGRRRGSEKWTRVTWTEDDAKRGGLTGKPNWQKWPRAMLIARATAELCRMLFADVLAGISYTFEELEDAGTAPANLVDFGPPELVEASAPAAAPPTTTKARARKPITNSTTSTEPTDAPAPDRGEVPSLPGDDDGIIDPPDDTEAAQLAAAVADPAAAEEATRAEIEAERAEASAHDDVDPDWPSGEWTSGEFPSSSDPQAEKRYTGPQLIAIILHEKFGISGSTAEVRAARLAAISKLIGRQIDSSNDLTPEEMGAVLERLRAAPEGATLDQVSADGQSEEVPKPPAAVAAPPEPPAEATKTPKRPAPVDPESWDGEKWREFLAQRKVKATATINEAARLGALRDPAVRIGTLDDVAGSGIAADLVGFVEDLSLQTRTK